MDLLKGYWRSLRQYLSTSKGRHDMLDYVGAIVIIGITCLVVYILMRALDI